MMDFFQRIYSPLIKRAIKIKYAVVAVATALLIISIIIFKNMGGEFIPTLEEGDFAIETRLLTGSSLSQSIDKVTEASDLLIKNYPEVIEVVGKIGRIINFLS